MLDIIARTAPHLWVYPMTHKVPHITKFVTGAKYLNRQLYPRQATLLKVMFLDLEHMTEYDYEVIAEWERTWVESADKNGEGTEGICPNVLDRIRINRICPCEHDLGDHGTDLGTECNLCDCASYAGRRWFREVISVIGRRGSKGYIGALAFSYILYHFAEKSDPQGYYGVDRDKRLSGIVFAGKKDQAKANQWGDINNVILGAPIFSETLGKPQSESLTVRSRHDLMREQERKKRGVISTADISTFEVVPKEATGMAARGPASFAIVIDECAHIVKEVARADASTIYETSTPSLDQFGVDGWIYLPSSPWQKIGLFREKYEQSYEVDEDGNVVYPEMLMVQFPSWELYRDWETAHELPMWADESESEPVPKFPRIRGAVQEYNEQMRQIERANPEGFRVERRSQWASVLDAYLNPNAVARLWEPYPEGAMPLTMQDRGMLTTDYRAHGDPSKSGARFGWIIAHRTPHDERGLPHVIVDKVTHWDPGDFEGHELDYESVLGDIKDDLDAFIPTEVTFDQFASVALSQPLQRYARSKKYPKRIEIYERPATGPLNWQTYEMLKTAINLGIVHVPFYDELNQELLFLQDKGGRVDHPTSGPIQTKDIADTLAIVVFELIGADISNFMGLSDLTLHASAQGGFDPYSRSEAHEALSSFGRGRRYQPPVGRPRRGIR